MAEPRHASVAVIGAGDYIGAAIVRRFAAEGYIVFAGRRNGDKLEPLRLEIEAAGGRIVTRSLDAREEDQVIAFLAEADSAAQTRGCTGEEDRTSPAREHVPGGLTARKKSGKTSHFPHFAEHS